MSRRDAHGAVSKPQNGLTRRRFLRAGLAGAAAGLGGGLVLGSCRTGRRTGRPNVFLITIDTLRADHLGCYGYTRQTSPFLDRFAADALVFENCFSHAPNTWASIASLLSGYLPHETRVMLDFPVPEGIPNLPEALRAQGYTTLGVVSNFVLRRGRGWERGFDVYDDSLPQRETSRGMAEKRATDATDQALRLLERHRDEDLFLWVHYQDPHGPYDPPGEFRDLFLHRTGDTRATRRPPLKQNRVNSGWGGIPSYQQLGDHRDYDFYVARYDAEIRYADSQIRRLVEGIRALGWYDDSLMLITADHGEGMGEKNYYFGHGENLYGSLTRVPLLARFGDGATGRRADFVQHIDVVPSILSSLGVPTGARLRGGDLRAASADPREIFGAMVSVGAMHDYESFVIYDGVKLIDQPAVPGLNRKRQLLFDLTRDPSEQLDRTDDPAYAERRRSLSSRLARLKQDDRLGLLRSLFEGHRELSDEERETLRALGYVE